MAETKYGKYIVSGSTKVDDGEHGVTLAFIDDQTVKGSYSCQIIRLPPPKTPYPSIPAHIHNSGQILVLLGTNQNDPYDLGAEVELCMGEEMEKHVITKPMIIYIPAIFLHGPWTIKRVDRPFTIVEIMQGSRGAKQFPQLTPRENKETVGKKYEKYFISGSPAEKGPGPNLGRIDDKTLEGCYGCQISWLPPENAPFPPHPPHVHDSAELLIHIGTNPDDPFDLGAEVELCMGKEMEKHVITKATVTYLPKGFIHGPWTIKRVDRPWISMKVGQGARGVGEHTLGIAEGKKGIMEVERRF